MKERSDLVSWIRSEVIGPSQPIDEPSIIKFSVREWIDLIPWRSGPVVWQPSPDTDLEEVLYFQRESPHRKYGSGILHHLSGKTSFTPQDQAALVATDTIGVEGDWEETQNIDLDETENEKHLSQVGLDNGEDFEVTSPDIRHPSTLGISLCIKLSVNGKVVVSLPRSRKFSWQESGSKPIPLNGRYELCKRRWTDEKGLAHEGPVWRRISAVVPECRVVFNRSDFDSGHPISKRVEMPQGSPIKLLVEIFPRQTELDDVWLMTIVLRNESRPKEKSIDRESILYQTHFNVHVEGGNIEKYPDSQRPFDQLDIDEQSLALLYRDSATWGIGHGCAAGWESELGKSPSLIFSDIFPAVQLPSMTPDIKDSQGNRLQLSMRSLASLSDTGNGEAWESLEKISFEYSTWIQRERETAKTLNPRYSDIANQHLNACESCLMRIDTGISLLKCDSKVRNAFRLANLAMLLQQIGTKQLYRRPLKWDAGLQAIRPEGEYRSPWKVFSQKEEDNSIGSWRAFQIAFLLMSLHGLTSEDSLDRETVDLIWFPTGGGKTEAYLAAMSFYMFYQRFLISDSNDKPKRDGTNVFMRYTLRMLTTQQFQRAASLITAMEFLRRIPDKHKIGIIPGKRFSLALWIGNDGTPNKITDAKAEIAKYSQGVSGGNPLVLTECPWCRAEIGRFNGLKSRHGLRGKGRNRRVYGITDLPGEGPLLHCTDSACSFGQEQPQLWLPIEVIDERIYRESPSLVIATADKLAMVAYRPEAGAIFGRKIIDGKSHQVFLPPGLIVQDELHLISGPLGTMYGLYEGIFESLCSYMQDGKLVRPKIIASTATIRGASEQVKALYNRDRTTLFPSPGLLMSDSFFGKYSEEINGDLSDGRLYVGIHANDYGSVLTTQVRTFSAALFRPYRFPEKKRDAWWTILAFYNSLRELGGAKTLFDSDIRSRLKFMFNREGFKRDDRRNLRIVEELTSRLSQAEIVGMMDRLSTTCQSQASNTAIDACLASNIIEVGVDIDRLSLMGVVGQPKTTATYIQVTGRVGRKWTEHPGLILMIYNPSKSRDRSHYEQFHSYHRRLYERVEPSSATPFALSTIQRALPGALITWARQYSDAPVGNFAAYENSLNVAFQILYERCEKLQSSQDRERSFAEMEKVRDLLIKKWRNNPKSWEEFPPSINGEYLMLWPGQFASQLQKSRGIVVPSSMRQVDASAELSISQGYVVPPKSGRG